MGAQKNTRCGCAPHSGDRRGARGLRGRWAIAQAGIPAALADMKPRRFSPAHQREGFAELVCSNSLKAKRLDSAAGLLKEEMKRLGSVCIPAVLESEVPPLRRRAELLRRGGSHCDGGKPRYGARLPRLRYGKEESGEGDYINCPLNKEEYEAFHAALVSAETAPLHTSTSARRCTRGVCPSRCWPNGGAIPSASAP